MPMKNPPHPGLSVRINCLEPLGLSVTEGAKVLGVSRQALSRLINGQAGISPVMAIRLSKAFGPRRTSGYGCKPPTTSPRPKSRNGMPVTLRPPHRYVCGRLTHTVFTSDGWRQTARHVACRTRSSPREAGNCLWLPPN